MFDEHFTEAACLYKFPEHLRYFLVGNSASKPNQEQAAVKYYIIAEAGRIVSQTNLVASQAELKARICKGNEVFCSQVLQRAHYEQLSSDRHLIKVVAPLCVMHHTPTQ